MTPPEPEPRGTTVLRYHHERVSLEDLAQTRESALALARSIVLMERELREPWAEARDARVLTQHVRALDPPLTAMAATAWEGAEARAAGADRRIFAEFGIYGTRRLLGAVLRRAEVASMEDYAGLLLATNREDTADGRLLAGWRHLAPEVSRRGPGYLSSCWQVGLGLDSEVALRDSLLGPFGRCAVVDAGSLSGAGPLSGVDAYQMPQEILELLLPAGSSPVASLIESLAQGRTLPRHIELAAGPAEPQDHENGGFLAAALRGLSEGMCDLDYLPAGLTTLSVTWSYLLEASEARATLALRRTGPGWMVQAFSYEPAGASLMGQRGAKLDLMPLLRARHARQ